MDARTAAVEAPVKFPRLYRPPAQEREQLAADPAPPRPRLPIRPGEVPEEDSTAPGWWPERWDGLA